MRAFRFPRIIWGLNEIRYVSDLTQCFIKFPREADCISLPCATKFFFLWPGLGRDVLPTTLPNCCVMKPSQSFAEPYFLSSLWEDGTEPSLRFLWAVPCFDFPQKRCIPWQGPQKFLFFPGSIPVPPCVRYGHSFLMPVAKMPPLLSKSHKKKPGNTSSLYAPTGTPAEAEKRVLDFSFHISESLVQGH